MRMLAVALSCLFCVGFGRRVHVATGGPVHQARRFARAEAPNSKDLLASLLLVRGGLSDVEDVRGGFADSLPMMRKGVASKTKKKQNIANSNSQVDATVGQAANTRGYADIPKRRRGSAGQVRKGNARSDRVLMRGEALKTWSFPSSLVDRVQVVLSTDGRPLDADVQLWQGPDSTPCKMRVYSEDGSVRPFSAVIATPFGGDNTIAVRNVGQIEFPLAAVVTATEMDEPISDFRDTSMLVQGGALRTYNFDTTVESVEVMLKTDGRPLDARIEMLQGADNQQVIELHTEDGLERPFFAIIDTPRSCCGNVVRVVNTSPTKFPMTASVLPHATDAVASALSFVRRGVIDFTVNSEV